MNEFGDEEDPTDRLPAAINGNASSHPTPLETVLAAYSGSHDDPVLAAGQQGLAIIFDANGVTVLRGVKRAEVVPESITTQRDGVGGTYRQRDTYSATYRFTAVVDHWRQTFHEQDASTHCKGRGEKETFDAMQAIGQAIAFIFGRRYHS